MATLAAGFNATRERAVLSCPRCDARLEVRAARGEGENACLACGAEVSVLLLPRLVIAAAPGAPPELAVAEDAVCFFHSSKAAQSACDACGRFLCGLCAIDIEARRLCPLCFETQRAGGALATLKARELQYDRLALWIAWASWPVWYFAPLILPAVLFLMFRYWRAPKRELPPRRRWRYVLALIVACAPLSIWAIFLIPGLRYGAHL